jgi:hypothetical protein
MGAAAPQLKGLASAGQVVAIERQDAANHNGCAERAVKFTVKSLNRMPSHNTQRHAQF